MKREEEVYQNTLPEGSVPVRLPKPPKRGWRLLLSLLLCGALFVAAFGLGLLLQTKDRIPGFFSDWLKEEPKAEQTPPAPQQPGESKNDLSEPPKEEPIIGNDTHQTIPDEAILIRKEHFSFQPPLRNRSIYEIDTDKLILPDPEKPTDEPLVLILTTHSSECYAEGEFLLHSVGDAIYSADADKGVLALADTLATKLNEHGIKAIFCNTNHDYPTLAGSYRRAGASIKAILEEFPSVCYVIDLRREELYASDGSLLGCIAEQEETTYAQISALVGSDGDGSEPFAWKENLALASEIGRRLNEICPEIFYMITVENNPHNQNLGAHSLTFKIGAVGNSIDEAQRSAGLLAQVLAEYLSGNQ